MSNDNDAIFPSRFVWTKMQAEAGQPLDVIVRRKERERVAGGGMFFWGIGSALGRNLNQLISREPSPSILFSIMRSRPKRLDATPTSLLLWTQFIDRSGHAERLPNHVLVLSRENGNGADRQRHYALVCSSGSPLRLRRLGLLDLSHFRNLGSSASRIGSSQVTAVVEHAAGVEHQMEAPLGAIDDGRQPTTSGPAYEVNMRAELAAPYFVRLAGPRRVSAASREAINAIALDQVSRDDWLDLVCELKTAATPVLLGGAPDTEDELFDSLS